MVSLTAAATGTLERTPLCQLLVYMLQRLLSGTVVFEAPNGDKSALSFAEGRITKARTCDGTLRLGQLLLERGSISSSELEALTLGASGELLGERLERDGVEREVLDAVLDEQVYRVIEAIAASSASTIYGYYRDHDMLANWGREPRKLDALRAIGRAFGRRPPHPAQVEAIVSALPSEVLRLHPQSRVGRFGFEAGESAVLDVLRAKPQPLAKLEQSGLLPPRRLHALLALLAMTHHLDIGGGWPLDVAVKQGSLPSQAARLTPRSRPGVSLSNARSSSSSSSAAAAPLRSGEREALREEIERRARLVQEQTYHELLGVEPPVDSSTVQAAFLQLAKRWHPDKLPAELHDLKPLANKVFARIAEAHQVLCDPARRAEYERHVGRADTDRDEQQTVERALYAVTSYQRAEVFVRKGDWSKAEQAAKQAMDADPEQPEYAALWAWIQVKSGQRQPDDGLDELLGLLNRAVRAAKDNVRVRLYRAFVLKWAGRVSDAMRDYRVVVELEPNHIEAQRELRLYRMRAEANMTPSQEGLLGKLFKK